MKRVVWERERLLQAQVQALISAYGISSSIQVITREGACIGEQGTPTSTSVV